MHNFIDLTASSRPWGGFSDDEDEDAFGITQNLRDFYKNGIWRLKQNDPNFCLLDLPNTKLSREVLTRIGIYLWQSKHAKTLNFSSCGLSGSKMEYLFGKIAMQNETNTYLLEEDILRNLGVNEQSLVSSVLDCLTSFSCLVKVDISQNDFGTRGLGILVQSLAGSPIEDLNLSECGLHGIFPLSGARHCKKLKKLNISGNTLGIDDADTVVMLMDNGYPKLQEFNLQGCDITDDFVEKISPALSNNKSLRYLWMNSTYEGFDTSPSKTNDIGTRGVAALSKAVHDSSTFENTLASNHTIRKIILSEADEDLFDHLFDVLWPNYCVHHYPTTYRIAWCKYIRHFVRTTEVVDMTPFMDLDINLIPNVLSIMDRDDYGNVALSACYKIWSCKMFRERINMTSQVNNLQARNDSLKAMVEELGCAQASVNEENEQLQSEIATLKEQIAILMASNAKSASSNKKIDTFEGSIGERVKKRNFNRKRGRRYNF